MIRASGVQPEYSAAQPPPPLPDYDQPPAPGDGYLWTPGYWAWVPLATTGFPATGFRLPTRARCGRPATGATASPLWILPRLLGAAHWLLWRRQLRLRLCRRRLPGRLLEWRPLQLQPLGQQHQRLRGAQRLQPLRSRKQPWRRASELSTVGPADYRCAPGQRKWRLVTRHMPRPWGTDPE